MKEKHKIALAIIAKDKEDIILRMLDSTKGAFDVYCLQDTGSSDMTVELFEAWCKDHKKECYTSRKKVGIDYLSVVVDGRDTLAEFGKARQDSFNLIPKDVKWAFWCDTDDVIQNAEQIPQLTAYCDKLGIDEVIMVYNYAPAVNGIVPVTQKRERLVNLRKKGGWRNWVHENYIITEPSVIAFMEQLPFNVYLDHLRTGFESLATNRRNNQIMKLQIEKEGVDKVPDEVLHHLAYDEWEHHEYIECIAHYQLLMKRWEGKQIATEMLFGVLIKLAQSYLNTQKLDESIKYALQAISVNKTFADGYLLMAQIYSTIGSWDEVEYYADKVLKLGKPNTTSPINEFEYSVVPLQYKLQVYVQRNDLTNAKKVTQQLKQLMPGNPDVTSQYFNLDLEEKRQGAIRAVDALGRYYQENNMAKDLGKLRQAIPIELLDDDVVRQKIKEFKSDETRKSRRVVFMGSKSIVIFAGQGYEDWDGESDVKKGIGGSEGMCIQLSRELAALGNKVIVYNSCGDSDGKTFDGVTYINWQKWDSNLKCDVFISLRRPDVFQKLIKATKQYLWLHDTEYGDVPLNLLYALNKIIVLTYFHKQVIKQNHGVKKDEIFWVTRNGLNKSALEYADKNAKKRNPYQLIYGSSYDRGLDNLLTMWPKIKQAVPEATLKIFYGTETMDKMIQIRAQNGDMATAQYLQNFKSRIIDMISKSDGVQELGRVSQNELYKNFEESGLWVYPTNFQEISCITAMTAQATGAFPVCTPVAALNETINGRYGTKVNLDQFAEAVIYKLKNQDETKRRKMMDWARKEFSMEELGKEWNLFLNED